MLDGKATVATRLEEAGSVLIAKLSMGALAMGDLWFGGDAQPMGPAQRVERQFGGIGIRGGRGACGVCDRDRDTGKHHLALPCVRSDRLAADLWPREPKWLHDARVDDGQAGADHPFD